jgi:hypothetical protein
LNLIGTQVTAEAWYLGLLDVITQQLKLKTDAIDWWKSHNHLGPAQCFRQFLEDVLLVEVDEPVVIFVDEIDATIGMSFTDDFFAAIRLLYNARAHNPTLKRVSFVLVGVATPSDLINDPKRTPFNIGQGVELTDFTFEEAFPLSKGWGLPEKDAGQVLDWILKWTNGHPYLTQQLCKTVAEQHQEHWSEERIDKLVAETYLTEKGKQDNNLQFVRDMMTKHWSDVEALLLIYGDVWQGKPVLDEARSPIKAHLKLSGAVRAENSVFQVRNLIYNTVFVDKWIEQNLPLDSVRKKIDYVRKRNQQLRQALTWAISALAIIGFLIVIQQRRQTLILMSDARARQLVAQGNATFGNDPLFGLRLAIEGLALTNNDELRLELTKTTRDLATLGRLAKVAEKAEDITKIGKNLIFLDYTNKPSELRSADNAEVIPVSGVIDNVIYSPDQQSFYINYSDTTGELRRIMNPEEVVTRFANVIFDITFSPTGTYFIVNYTDATNELREFSDVIFSPNESFFVVEYVNSSGELRHTTSPDKFVAKLSDKVDNVIFSPNGDYFIVKYSNVPDELHRSGQAEITRFSGDVLSATFSPDGNYFVVAYIGTSGELWNVIGLRSEIFGKEPIVGAEFSNDNTHFVIHYSNDLSELRTVSGKVISQFFRVIEGDPLSTDYFVLINTEGIAELWKSNGEPQQLGQLGLNVEEAILVNDYQQVYVRLLDGSVYLVDTAWVEEIGNLSDSELVNYLCNGPFKSGFLDQNKLRDALDGQHPEACQT